jgi:hypothetical protein
LLASTPADEDVAWDEESDDEASSSSSDTQNPPATTNLAASTKTLKPVEEPASDEHLKPAQPRRSNDEKSVADSDASYDLVSGTTSRAPSRTPGSPQLDKKNGGAEESEEEEDWE